MAWLIGKIILAARGILASRGAQIGAGAIGVADVLNIDIFRREAVRVSPSSDPEALEEAARAVHWMMGLSDSEIIGPRKIEDWNYFHYDPVKGRGWWTKRYLSSKSLRRAGGRGRARGFVRGLSRAVQTRSLSR